MNTCSCCGITDKNVQEEPTYSQELKRDTTEYLCKDADECLKRKEA